VTWSALVTGALGVVFLWSGTAKRVRPEAWHRQASEFGTPHWLAVALPWVELGVGACLLAQVWRPWPAVVATVMLVGFTTAISIRLAQGRRPPCACFGASAHPIGPWTLVRNALLLVLAVEAVLSAL
jgi:uncharacterized membrane protein YphA (DoxX/SURF4 family)